MPADNEKTVVMAVTRTAFEAETIAAALRDRGVDARVFDAAISLTWGATMGPSTGVKVVVLEHEVEAARRAMDDIRVESASIDWDAVDLGADPAVQKLAQFSKARRWVWTVVILLVPAGLFVLAYGVDRGDAMIKMMGGILLAAAAVMTIFQLGPERRGQ